MSRDSQQFARAALPVLKLVRQKLGVGGLIGLVVAALLYLAVIQPLVASRFGVTLPTLVDLEPPVESPTPPPGNAEPGATPGQGSPGQGSPGQGSAGQGSPALTEIGRDTYRSAAGLRYTRGSRHGTRLEHLMSHAHDDPDRVGQHGVFDSDDQATVVRLVDEAYQQALAGVNTHTEREGEQTVYDINMGRRIGYVGGQSGNRRGKPAAMHLRLVVQGDRLITAFPFRP
ncbi:hypothetical protein Pla108_30450 [Botrimarina colliarenosi]|uniref:Bacterial CdiA-CT RNAse A domain-containing protein n=1 Tax=Botrimarina colliarenosi TaxID=2528001 RepID=A0A5C6A9E1_9BACT|nr:hypothetical protein [Botrimarina colliarenosi]TWT95967.1 hypothetical protein Pla108_30450 [Botrimarina colliarenosi]